MRTIHLITSIAICAVVMVTSCSVDKEPFTGLLSNEKQVRARVIYGQDDRKDLYEVRSPTLLKLAKGTLALMRTGDLTLLPGGDYLVNGDKFGTAYNLCRSEPYYEQHIAAFCSGFLVGPDQVITAGHCIRNQSACRDSWFVFDFSLTEKGKLPHQIPAQSVYRCKELVYSEVIQKGSDYAILKLDRPVKDRAPLRFRSQGEINIGDDLVVIGHPAGLPTKIAGGASVRSLESEYFVANLDTYGGNSGSAVFNSVTGLVEGILVRGEIDFVTRGGCRISNQCPDEGCRGEHVTKITQALDHFDTPTNRQPSSSEIFRIVSDRQLPIPDGDPQGLSSILEVSDAPRGRDVQVYVNIEHSWRQDLTLILETPTGQLVVLHDQTGGSSNDIKGSFGASLNSEEDLGELSQIEQPGLWKLHVLDSSRWDQGYLLGWGLTFSR